MIVPIGRVANWIIIYQRKETLIDKNTYQGISTRSYHNYKFDD